MESFGGSLFEFLDNIRNKTLRREVEGMLCTIGTNCCIVAMLWIVGNQNAS
jgi:hypothetical protein